MDAPSRSYMQSAPAGRCENNAINPWALVPGARTESETRERLAHAHHAATHIRARPPSAQGRGVCACVISLLSSTSHA